MANYWDIVNRVITGADLLLFVLDARQPDATLNPEIERKIKHQRKQLVYVLNKCDLVSEEALADAAARLKPSVYVSCTKYYGATRLRHAILHYGMPAAQHYGHDSVRVGVIGYPNVGKSSVINLLRGKGVAGTSAEAGFTRGYQHIRLGRKILLIDTPGVLARERKDETAIAMLGAKNPSDLKDPDLAAIALIEELEGVIEKHYGVLPAKDMEETLERIARKHNYLKKGGKPDIDRISRRIIQDWQHGKIKRE